jgi:hypothetical protein
MTAKPDRDEERVGGMTDEELKAAFPELWKDRATREWWRQLVRAHLNPNRSEGGGE